MKKIILILAALTITLTGLNLALAADAPAKPLAVTNYGTKGIVTFDHARHTAQKITCVSCHHKGTEGPMKCGTCHGAEEKDKAPAIKEAMHGKEKGACYNCHNKSDAANKKKCADCHAG